MAHKRIRRNRYDLWKWRVEAGLTQSEAAKQFGLSQQHWQRLETGQRHPRPGLAMRLIRGTGVPLEVLMGIDQ